MGKIHMVKMVRKKRVLGELKHAVSIASIIVFTIVGCTSGVQTKLAPTATAAQSMSSPPITMSADILHDWFHGLPCRPPCWQGIIPAKTTTDQAIGILQGSSVVTDVQVFTDPDIPRRGEVVWKLTSNSLRGSIYFDGEPSTVTAIRVPQSERYTLQQIIDVYGEPSHVMAYASPCIDTDCIVYRLDVLFVSQGFVLDWYGASNSVKPTLNPESNQFVVKFFEPTLEGYLIADGNPSNAEIIRPWQGMLSFDAYCLGPGCENAP